MATTRLCPYMLEPTRLCPDTFVPTHVCTHTHLCPGTIVPRHVCAHTRLCPEIFVPTHVCAQKIYALICNNHVVTIMSGHKCVWAQTYISLIVSLTPSFYSYNLIFNFYELHFTEKKLNLLRLKFSIINNEIVE